MSSHLRILSPLLLAALSLTLTIGAPLHAEDSNSKDKAPEKTESNKADTDEKKKSDTGPMKTDTFKGLALRSIGPAMVSGRIADLAVDPTNKNIRYVAAASGGLWKTTNAGTTWKPIFDDQGSYSLGSVKIDPKNPLTIWVGSGENNSQRAVQYGDGVYKSLDGGTTWNNMGLKTSEHISTIAIDPRDSNVVWVAAQGPLWRDGGERGLYVTRDGGKTWTKAFETSPHTGVTEVFLDPRNPDVMFATTYQRRRRVWTLIDGGPESGLRKSTDGGKTWRKITNGLPKGDIGRIGMAISPAKPDTMYAIIEATGKETGMYRSVDGGENWEKRSRLRQHQSAGLQPDRGRSERGRSRVLDGHVDECQRRRRQDHAHASARSTSTSTTTRCGSIPTTAIICSPVATVASTKAGTAARPGSGATTCRCRSSTRSDSTTRSRSTTSTAARRTTTRSAARRAIARRTASSIPTGSSWSKATASSRWSIRPTRT